MPKVRQNVELEAVQWSHCRVQGAMVGVSGQGYIRRLINADMPPDAAALVHSRAKQPPAKE